MAVISMCPYDKPRKRVVRKFLAKISSKRIVKHNQDKHEDDRIKQNMLLELFHDQVSLL